MQRNSANIYDGPNMDKTPKLNPAKLTEDQRRQLDTWNQNKQIITNLEDMASIFQEFLNVLDKSTNSSDKNSQQMGSLLMDMREALNTMKAQKAPEMPDYAKPVVSAVSSLEKALTASIKAIDVKPEVNVAGAKVETVVDLSKIEKILKTELPKAFKDAIKLIPETEVPESDYTPLTELMNEISQKLDSIDTGVRLKPAGVNAKITNTSDITGALPLKAGTDFDLVTVTNTGATTDELHLTLGVAPVQTITITYATSSIPKVSDDIASVGFS